MARYTFYLQLYVGGHRNCEWHIMYAFKEYFLLEAVITGKQ